MSNEQVLRDALERLIAVDEAHETIHAPDGDDIARMIEYSNAFENARAVLSTTALAEQKLRAELQVKCCDWGVYWRAPDAHGVNLSHEQALELLRDALCVEVEIAAPTAQAKPVAYLFTHKDGYKEAVLPDDVGVEKMLIHPERYVPLCPCAQQRAAPTAQAIPPIPAAPEQCYPKADPKAHGIQYGPIAEQAAPEQATDTLTPLLDTDLSFHAQRLRRACKVMGVTGIPEDDETLIGCMGTVLGKFCLHVEQFAAPYIQPTKAATPSPQQRDATQQANERKEFDRIATLYREAVTRCMKLEDQIAQQAIPAEPVARLTHRDNSDELFDIVILDRARCTDGMPLFAAPQPPVAQQEDVKDAAIWRYLKPRFAGYDFYFGGKPDADTEAGKGIITANFQVDADFSGGRNIEGALLAAVAAAQKGEAS